MPKLSIKLSFTLRVFNIYWSLTLGNFSDYKLSRFSFIAMLKAFSRNFHFAAPLRDFLPRTVNKGISPMLSYLHRAAELIFLLYINWAKNRTMIAIERMQVPKHKALYPSINVNGNDNDNSWQSFYSHNSGTRRKKKKRKLQKNGIDIDYITICTIFESVCNSQRSKAFQLAAVYLQVKKGTQERNNN